MTNILDLPEEILYTIFKKCEQRDLRRFQRVCHVWYFPAHVTFLNDVEISDIPAIQLFIDSIDCNPNPAYLKAVKTIEFETNDDFCTFQFNDKLNRKLFYRFPKLKGVYMDDSQFLGKFNDKMCIKLLKNCPQLEIFMVASKKTYDYEYRKSVNKAKLLITDINLEKLEGRIPKQFLYKFPRLRAISGHGSLLTNFSQLLQILEHAPNLTSFHMYSEINHENDAETQLLSKPKEEQDKLMNQLSKIDKVDFYYPEGFCANSLDFALKYLTGIDDFTLYSGDSESWWRRKHENVFCDLISNVHKFEQCRIQFVLLPYGRLAECFPIAVEKVLSSTIKRTKTLKLTIHDIVELAINTDDSDTDVSLILDDRFSLTEIGQNFFETVYENVERFDLKFTEDGKEQDLGWIYRHSYDSIIGRMPNLKELILDITNDFVDKDDQAGCEIKLPLVESFTIRATVDAKFQSLLDSYCFALPNLKRLAMFYSSGTFDKNMSEFCVKLSSYSLESLHLDVTPIRVKSTQLPDSKADGFFVVEAELLETSERHLYKISFDLSTVTRLDYSDLKGFIRGEDYLFVRVTIRSLQNLTLFTINDFRQKFEEDYYDSELTDFPHVMILENNQWKS